MDRWRRSCEDRGRDWCIIRCSASIVANVAIVCFQGILVLCTRCNVGVIVALVIAFSTFVIRRSWCCRQVGALPAGRSRGLSRWWRRRRPRRYERAATRNRRHAARSLLSGCCVRCTFFSAEVRCPLGLRRRLALARHWRRSCSDWEWRLCRWCLGRELPD